MTVLSDPHSIERYRLVVLRAAIRLEIAGLHRRGRSASSIAAEMLGLPKGTKRTTVFTALDNFIKDSDHVVAS